MWYTLAKGFAWFVLAGVIGILVGWLLRSIVAGRQLSRARGRHPSNVDAAEIERLRDRIGELESVAVERDRLLVELAACRDAVTVAERNTGEQRAIRADEPRPSDSSDDAASSSAPRDLSAAAAAVAADTPAEADDLTAIEGIGPRIAELCEGIGIRTWAELAATEVSLLRTMLADAGPRFRTHDPSTWPRQAELLAAGRLEEFQQLIDELDGGRATS